MNTDDLETWDDWTRPARLWPLAVVIVAPLIEIAVIAWFVSRHVVGS